MKWIFLLAPISLIAQTQLPDAPGKDVVVRVCTTCHGPGQLTSTKRDREHWKRMVDRMAAMGAKGSEADFKTVLEYLAANFGAADASATVEIVDVNHAAGWRIARTLKLTPEEGDRIAVYREEHGGFRSIDDLAKVVDRAKVEAAKDRIVFGRE